MDAYLSFQNVCSFYIEFVENWKLGTRKLIYLSCLVKSVDVINCPRSVLNIFVMDVSDIINVDVA